MPEIMLGNVATIERRLVDSETGEHVVVSHPPTTTVYGAQEEHGFLGQLENLVGHNGAWNWHSTESPAWVAGNDDALVQAVARHYGCPVGKPDDWDDYVREQWVDHDATASSQAAVAAWQSSDKVDGSAPDEVAE